MQERSENVDLKDKIRNVCCVSSVFALLQYLLSQDINVAMSHTYYFFGDGISENIRQRFVYHTSFGTVRCGGWKMMKRRLLKIKLRLFGNFIFPFMNSAVIYAQDHFYFSWLLIGNKDYILLSDSQNVFTQQLNPGRKEYDKYVAYQSSVKYRLMAFVLGHLSIRPWGFSKQCKQVMLTRSNVSEVLSGKELRIKSFAQEWNEASEDKKKSIMSVFGCDAADRQVFENINVVVLTQPFYDDKVLTEEEHFEVYRQAMGKYDNKRIVMKVHPRDTFEYERYFRDVEIYRKPVPMELLSLWGVNIETAVTFFSSSVYCFDDNVAIDWIGTKGNDKLKDFYGEF